MTEYDVEVEWLDGKVKRYNKVSTQEEDGLMSIMVQRGINQPRTVLSIIPLVNVREVTFP